MFFLFCFFLNTKEAHISSDSVVPVLLTRARRSTSAGHQKTLQCTFKPPRLVYHQKKTKHFVQTKVFLFFNFFLIVLCSNSNSVSLNFTADKRLKTTKIECWSWLFMWNYNPRCFVVLFFSLLLFSFPTGGWPSVCLSVSPCGFLYQAVLPVYRSVFQSVRSFVGESSSHRGPKMP